MSNRYYVYGCKLFLLGCTDSYYTILSVLEDKWTFTAKKSFSLPYYSQSKVLRPNRQYLHRRCRCCCCKVLHRSIQEDRGLKKFVLAKVWGVSLGERERKRAREREREKGGSILLPIFLAKNESFLKSDRSRRFYLFHLSLHLFLCHSFSYVFTSNL